MTSDTHKDLVKRLRGPMPDKPAGVMPLSGVRCVDFDWAKIEAERKEAADTIERLAASAPHRLRADRDRLRKEIEDWSCPHPANGAPDQLTVKECMSRSECGCRFGTALQSSTGAA